MHPMMFLLILIMPPCINLSLNDAYNLANHTASRLNLTIPYWLCINDKLGICPTYPRVSVAHPSSPATRHHPMHNIWSWHGLLGKSREKLHALALTIAVYIYSHDNICIPPKPLFSLLTNVPQMTFLNCLKSNSQIVVSGKPGQLTLLHPVWHFT